MRNTQDDTSMGNPDNTQLPAIFFLTIRLRPDIYKKAGARLNGKSIAGGLTQLKSAREGLEKWLRKSGKVSLEMDIRPFIDDIDKVLAPG